MPSIPAKIALREKAVAARSSLRPDVRRELTARVSERALGELAHVDGVIGLYVPIRGEIHPGALAERLAALGKRLALPCTRRLTDPLLFRVWAPGDPLVRGRMNIPEPSPDAPEVTPQALLVPPVGFDRRGYRIGYGAGFYDRTIPILRHLHPVLALGFAFACQEVERVPDEQHDVPLDAIATEAELIVPEPR